jgi:uncharacterized membrane protein
MMWGSVYGSAGGSGVMMLVYLVVSVLVIPALVLAIVWFIRSQRTNPVSGGGMSARAMLDARNTRGEINEAELAQYRQRPR